MVPICWAELAESLAQYRCEITVRICVSEPAGHHCRQGDAAQALVIFRGKFHAGEQRMYVGNVDRICQVVCGVIRPLASELPLNLLCYFLCHFCTPNFALQKLKRLREAIAVAAVE